MYQHKYLTAWVGISADVIFWSALLASSQSLWRKAVSTWFGAETLRWRENQSSGALLWPSCPRVVVVSSIGTAWSQPVISFKAWKAEAAALKLVKVLILSLKIYPTLKLWRTAKPFIQAVTCLSPTLSAWTWLLCAEVRAGTLVVQLVRYLWESHGRFLLECDFCLWRANLCGSIQKETMIDHYDFSGWCGCFFTQVLHKVPNTQEGQETKQNLVVVENVVFLEKFNEAQAILERWLETCFSFLEVFLFTFETIVRENSVVARLVFPNMSLET